MDKFLNEQQNLGQILPLGEGHDRIDDCRGERVYGVVPGKGERKISCEVQFKANQASRRSILEDFFDLPLLSPVHFHELGVDPL